MRRALERYGASVVAILALGAVAVVTGSYILLQQRLSNPFQERYEMKGEFAATSGLTPGLGQAVNVAGVKVGTITDVELRDGRALVSMEVDPGELPRVYANARAVLQPVTPAKDLEVALFPGGKPARVISPGGTIPVARTDVPVDSDELTALLDRDTRDFLETLVSSGGDGLRDRGRDLRALLRALGPTSAQLEDIGAALADRRAALRRLVHNLAMLTRAAGAKDRELADVVEAANATVGALAGEDVALRQSIARLPGTLAAARRTLGRTPPFADELGRAVNALQPSARRLPSALRAARPLVDTAVPILRNRVRPFVRETIPLGRDLQPAIRDLNIQTPHLTSAFAVLQYVGNELGHNPPGDNEGFLFWTAWLFHNLSSAVSTEDAHGAAARGLALTSCESFVDFPDLAPVLQLIVDPLPTC